MTTRAKFKLTSETIFHWGSSKELKFTTEYDNSIPEDMRFNKATPSGTIVMLVDNPLALEKLKLGKYYYVDFVEIETK